MSPTPRGIFAAGGLRRSILAVLAAGLASGAAASTITIDAADTGNEWNNAGSAMDPAGTGNIGCIGRNSSGHGQFIWDDASNDTITDHEPGFPSSNVDLREVRITGDATNMYVYVKMRDITFGAGNGAPQVMLAVDTDQVNASGQPFFPALSDTRTHADAEWEVCFRTQFGDNSGTTTNLVGRFDQSFGFSTVGATAFSIANDVIEMRIPWTAIPGLSGPPTSRLRFTMMSAYADTINDTFTLPVGSSAGDTRANAIDVVSNFGNPSSSSFPNTFAELNNSGDQTVDYYFDVWFESDGDVVSPLVISQVYANTSGSDTVREWVEVFNATGSTLGLNGFRLGDLELPVDAPAAETCHSFGGTATIGAGAFQVAARGATGAGSFQSLYGYLPDYEMTSTSGSVPDMPIYPGWAAGGGTFDLANAGSDSVLLIDQCDTIIDVLAYGATTVSGNTPIAISAAAEVYQRVSLSGDTNDCSVDFQKLTNTTLSTMPGQNDAPAWTAPASVNATEDTNFSFIGVNLITGADLESTGGTLTGGVPTFGVAISVTNGNLQLASTAGLIGLVGNGTANVSFTATMANINAAMNGLLYRGDLNFNGTDTLDLLIGDGGKFGSRNGAILGGNTLVTINVGAVNDPPTVTNTGGNTLFTEDGGAVAVDAGVTVADADSATLASATVTIAATPDGVAESLNAATLVGGITQSYVSGTQTLTLTGPASLADFQTVLASVGYDNTSQNPTGGIRTISFRVFDGTDLSLISTKGVQVAGTNDAATVPTSGGTTPFVEDGGPVTVDAGLAVADPDSATLVEATATITNLFDGVAESLTALSLPGGIVQSYDSGTGVLTLTGSTSPFNFQLALGSVVYNNTSQNPNTTTRQIAFAADDGSGYGASNTKGVTVGAVNDAPVTTIGLGLTSFTEDGGPVTVAGTTTVSDADHATLASATVRISVLFDGAAESLNATALPGGMTQFYDSGTGVLTLTGPASVADFQTAMQSVQYDNSDQNPDTTTRDIRFQAFDGVDLGTVAQRNVTVGALNDAPVVTATGGNTPFVEDAGPVTVDAAITVSDVDNATLAFVDVIITNLLDGAAESLNATSLPGGITQSFAAGTLTLTGPATLADFQAAMASVEYNNTSDTPDTTTRLVRFLADDGTDAGGGDKNVTITGTNDPPVLATTVGATAFVEDAGPVTVDGGFTASDPDTATLDFLIVAITNPLDGIAESLNATALPGGITQFYDSGTGELMLSGPASIADFIAAGASVQYDNSSDTPDTTTRQIDFLASDGIDASNIASKDVTVGATNDVPTVVVDFIGVTPFEEDAGAVVVDPTVTVTDPDSPILASATVAITNLLDGILESLNATALPGGITQSYDSGTGVLTLTGPASAADFQAAMASVEYNNLSDTPNTSVRNVAFRADDGIGISPAANHRVSVTAANDPPVGTTTAGATAFTEDGGAVTVDAGFTDSDVDDTDLELAFVQITNLLDGVDESLAAASLPGGLVESYDSGTGILEISGTASLADYETAIASVRYNNISQDPDTTTRVISFLLFDGQDVSVDVFKDVTVGAVNDPPMVDNSPGATAFAEDGGPVTVDSAVTVADADNATLASATVTIANQLDGAAESLSAPFLFGGITASFAGNVLTLTGPASLADFQSVLQSVTYDNSDQDPDPTPRNIEFVLNDGTDPSATDTKVVTVAPSNDAPVVALTGGSALFTEDGGPVAVDAGSSISDVDSATLASVTLSFTAIPDGAAESLNATALPGGITQVFAGSILTLTGPASLADFETAIRSVEYDNSSQNPTAGSRFIEYEANDGTDISVLVSAEVVVGAVNDAPAITTTVGDTTFTEDGGPVVVDAGLTLSDVDNATIASATVTITATPDGAAESLNATVLPGGIVQGYALGTLTLTGPASVADFQAALASVEYDNTDQDPDTLTRFIAFQANDGTDPSAIASKNVVVVAVNDAPVVAATPGSATFTEDGGPVVVDAAATISDADSATLSFVTVTLSPNPDGGAESLNATALPGGITQGFGAGTLTLTGPASVADFQAALRSVEYDNSAQNPTAGSRFAEILAHDGSDPSVLASREIVVVPVNDAPFVSNAAGSTAFAEDGGPVVVDAATTVTDVDHATVAFATVTITNNLDGAAETLNATALPGGIVQSFAAGVLTLTGPASHADFNTALSSVAYDNSSQNPNTTTRVIEFVANDGTDPSAPSTRDVTIAAVNDAPAVATTAGAAAFVEDGGPVVVDAASTVSDVDSATLTSLTVTLTAVPDGAAESLNATALPGGIAQAYAAGVLTLTGPASLADFQTAIQSIEYDNSSQNPTAGSRFAEYVANDGTDPSAIASREITVAPVNDPPTVTTSIGDTAFVEDAGAVAVDAAVTVSDVDSATLAFATVTITNDLDGAAESLNATALPGGIVQGYAAGVLTLTGPASLADFAAALASVEYNNLSDTPDTTTRVVEFVVNDGTDPSAAATKNVTIAASNDAPVVATSIGDTAFVEDAGPVVVDAAVTASDADSATLASATVTITNLLDGAAESLTATALPGGITQVYAAGVLTLTGPATPADFQAAMASVEYDNLSNTPNTTTRVVEFLATDGLLPSIAATKNVTVAPSNDPPTAVVQNLSRGVGPTCDVTVSASEFNNGSSDPEDGAALTFTFEPGGLASAVFTPGVYNLTIRATDSGGLFDEEPAVLTVADSNPPTVVAQDITVFLDAAGNASITPFDVFDVLGSVDDCGPVTPTLVAPNTFTCSDIGSPVTVTLTGEDASLNSSTDTATVTVVDNLPPTFSVPGPTLTVACNTLFGANVDFSTYVTFSDNCDPSPSIFFNPATPNFFTIAGSPHPITFTVVDAAGNADNGSFDIVVTCTDDDFDGVLNVVELAAPNAGDGDGDSITDDQQPGVASLPEFAGADYVTMVLRNATQFQNVQSVDPGTLPAAPGTSSYPVGFFSYQITNFTGTPLEVDFLLPAASGCTSFYNYGPEIAPPDAWYEFTFDGTTGATNPVADTITVRFADGLRGDTDLGANNIIRNVGGPSAPPTSVSDWTLLDD